MTRDFDGYLDWLVNGPREIRSEVTLNVCGTLVSGKPITEDEYLELAQEFLQSEMDRHGFTREAFRQRLLEEGVPPEKLDEAMEAGEQARYNDLLGGFERSDEHSKYIHLRDVQIRGSGLQGYLSPIWRGRLSSVDGFIFGGPSVE